MIFVRPDSSVISDSTYGTECCGFDSHPRLSFVCVSMYVDYVSGRFFLNTLIFFIIATIFLFYEKKSLVSKQTREMTGSRGTSNSELMGPTEAYLESPP